MKYVPEEADQYERAWLLLADIYISSGKFDLAQVWCAVYQIPNVLIKLESWYI